MAQAIYLAKWLRQPSVTRFFFASRTETTVPVKSRRCRGWLERDNTGIDKEKINMTSTHFLLFLLVAGCLSSGHAHAADYDAIRADHCIWAVYDGDKLTVKTLQDIVQVQVRFRPYSFTGVSGPYGNKCLPDGAYLLQSIVDTREDGMGCNGDLGWKVRLLPTFATQRSGLLIHPDGGVLGTLGCIGIRCADAANAKEVLKRCLRGRTPGSPLVLIANIPRAKTNKMTMCSSNPYLDLQHRSEAYPAAIEVSVPDNTESNGTDTLGRASVPQGETQKGEFIALFARARTLGEALREAVRSGKTIGEQNGARIALEDFLEDSVLPRSDEAILLASNSKDEELAKTVAITMASLNSSASEAIPIVLARAYAIAPSSVVAALRDHFDDPVQLMRVASQLRGGADTLAKITIEEGDRNSSGARLAQLVKTQSVEDVKVLAISAAKQLSNVAPAETAATGITLDAFRALGVEKASLLDAGLTSKHLRQMKVMKVIVK